MVRVRVRVRVRVTVTVRVILCQHPDAQCEPFGLFWVKGWD